MDFKRLLKNNKPKATLKEIETIRETVPKNKLEAIYKQLLDKFYKAIDELEKPKNGTTPKKGIDYYTDSEKEKLLSELEGVINSKQESYYKNLSTVVDKLVDKSEIEIRGKLKEIEASSQKLINKLKATRPAEIKTKELIEIRENKDTAEEIARKLESITDNNNKLDPELALKGYKELLKNIKRSYSMLSGVISDHNSLENIQGGAIGKYYHLSEAQFTDLISVLASFNDTGVFTSNGRRRAVITKTANYTATENDEVIKFTSNATLTLPSATGSGQYYLVRAVGCTVVIDGNGTDTINEELTQTLYAGDSVQIVDDGVGTWGVY